ncbi:MAG: flagellin [Planctomycetota bacterium]
MTRINTNVSSLVAQNRLRNSNEDLQSALTRLSTGLRINSGADDPAGLIASEALRSEITSLGRSISNTNRASQIISTADSALGEVSNLLNDVRGLVVEAANNGALSEEEIAANQLQIDSSLEAINRIAQTTTFQGRKLLDGSLDFQSTSANVATLKDINIDQANLGSIGKVDVDVVINSAATRAEVVSTGIPGAATAVNSTGTITFGSPSPADEASGTLAFTDTFEIGEEVAATVAFANAFGTGNEGSAEINIGNDGTNDAGVTITAVNGEFADGIVANSTDVTITSVANGTASTASFDSGSNTLTLNIEAGETVANILTDLQNSGVDEFDFSAASTLTGTDTTTSVNVGTQTDPIAGGTPGTAEPAANFRLTAVEGGPADGAIGNATVLNITSGASTAAVYNTADNELSITVAAGDTIDDIVTAINASATASLAFSATNVSNGGQTYSATDNFTGAALGTTAGAITNVESGTNPTLASSFDIEAIDGQAADGTTGNAVQIDITAGATTGATYDGDTNTIAITAADGATTQDLANAVNSLTEFVVRNVQNGNALFDNTSVNDVGTDVGPTFTGGTDSTVDDVITVTADEANSSFDGRTITINGTNSLAEGAATASLDNDGNIVVNVSNLGAGVNVGTISAAIDSIEGFSASVTATNGDGVYLDGTDTAPTTTALANGVFGGGLNADLVFQLSGAEGSEVFQFEKGSSLDSIIQSINLVSDATGITAEDDGGNLKLSSTTYGSNGTIDVEIISEGAGGTFKSGLSAQRTAGKDIDATINGVSADANGNTFSINTSTLDISLTVNDGSSTDFSFEINGGGAQFQLGPDVTTTQQARLGIGSVSTGQLGGAAGRLYELGSGQGKSLAQDVGGAAQVIDEVIGKVTGLRGRLGAFQSTTLDSNLVSLNETRANLQEAESSIRDADFAEESALLTRAQILTQSGTNVLSLANQQPQNVLSLLR